MSETHIIPAAHARVGPSSFYRTTVCTASVLEIERRGIVDEGNAAAAEGSVLHDIAAECLLNGDDPYSYVGKEITHGKFSFIIDDEHAECMMDGLDWIRQQPGELFVEFRVSLDHWMADQFGTGDVAILQQVDTDFDDVDPHWWRGLDTVIKRFSALFEPFGITGADQTTTLYRAVIFDWKFGEGVPVHVEDNMQLKGYALGFLLTVFLPRGVVPAIFRLIIEQPRNHEGGRYWEHYDISLEDLLLFGEELRAAYTAICAGGEFKPEEKACSFCPVRNTPTGCAAYESWILDMIDMEFSDLDVLTGEPPTFNEVLTPERRGYVVKHRNLIIAFLKQLYAQSMEAAQNGEPDPGLKPVRGRRGKRVHSDVAFAGDWAEYALGEDAYTKTLKTFPQIEKLLKPTRKREGNSLALAFIESQVIQKEARPILVSSTDPRPALTSWDDDDFDDLEPSAHDIDEFDDM